MRWRVRVAMQVSAKLTEDPLVRFGRVCAQYHLHMHKVQELKPKTIVKLFEAIGAFKRPEDLDRFTVVCQSDSQGRQGLQDTAYPQKEYVKQLFEAASRVTGKDISQTGLSGKLFGEKLFRKRILEVKNRIEAIRTKPGLL